MLTYIESLPTKFRFYKPETNELAEDIFVKPYEVACRLSDAQVIALTLNEVCVTKSRGKLLWVSMGNPNWIEKPGVVYFDKQWTDEDKKAYWKETPVLRLKDCKAQEDPIKDATQVLGLLTKAFNDPKDEDEMCWFANTEARSILCYRSGVAYIGWAEDWKRSAKLNSAWYQALRWQDIDQSLLSCCSVGNHAQVTDRLEELLERQCSNLDADTESPIDGDGDVVMILHEALKHGTT